MKERLFDLVMGHRVLVVVVLLLITVFYHIMGEFDYKVDLVNQIKNIMKEERERTGMHFYLAGVTVQDEVVFRYNERDQAIFFPIMG